LLASEGVKFVPGGKTFYRVSGASSLSYIGSSERKVKAQMLSCKLHIQYLRSMGDNARVRAAALAYLQRYFFIFYPEWPEVARDAQELATTLGGKLDVPRMSWKYALIEKALGLGAAKRVQLRYNSGKTRFLNAWDNVLSQIDKRALKP
jgi:hypothetical protein